MGRIGCPEGDALEELAAIQRLKTVEVHSISTHLPVADEDSDYTRLQLNASRNWRQSADARPQRKIHVLNSAGILGFSSHAHDLVGPGLMLYGSAYPAKFQPLLRPALTWKTRILLVRDVGPNQSVSYGRTFITPHPMRIATLAVGYADGFPRQVSGRGAHVWWAGSAVRCSAE